MSRINSNAGMRPRRVRRLLALMASGAVLAGAGLGWGVSGWFAPMFCAAVICTGMLLPYLLGFGS